jgi:hypothetical protein
LGFRIWRRKLPAKWVEILGEVGEALKVGVGLLAQVSAPVPRPVEMGIDVGELDAELGFVEVGSIRGGEELDKRFPGVFQLI